MKLLALTISLFLACEAKFSMKTKFRKFRLNSEIKKSDKEQENSETQQGKEYYFDTSKNFDAKDYHGKVLAMTQKGVDNTHFVPQYSHFTKSFQKTATTEEQPYYDPTMNDIGAPEYPNASNNGLWYVPIKVQTQADRLKMDRIRRQNVLTQNFLYKHDKPLNQVYYDASINPPSLQVEDQMQKTLRLNFEKSKEKKSVPLQQHINKLQDQVLTDDLVLNRQQIYLNELPDKRIQRQNEVSQQMASGYYDNSITN